MKEKKMVKSSTFTGSKFQFIPGSSAPHQMTTLPPKNWVHVGPQTDSIQGIPLRFLPDFPSSIPENG